MDGNHPNNVVDVDVGNPPIAPRHSPTFRVHFHDFKCCTENYYVTSPVFTCFGHYWAVRLFPFGINGGGTVSFYLKKRSKDNYDSDSSSSSSDSSSSEGDDKRINVQFTISVKDLDGKEVKRRKKVHNFDDWKDEKGFSSFLERATIMDPANNILRDGTLTVEVQLESLDVTDNDSCQPFFPSNPLANNMNKLFLDENTADVLFTVQKEDGGETVNFYAHRLVLKACAPNLASFCESTNDLTPITISRVDPHVFKLLLFYVYGGTISTSDWKLHSKDLIDASDLYGVINLKLEAEAKYAAYTTVTTENVVDLLMYADSKQCAHLKEVAMDFVVQNHGTILKQVASLKNVPESATMFTDLLTAVARDSKTGLGNSEDLDTMRVGALRRKCHEKGLDVDGSREALIARLKDASKKAGEKRKRASSQEDVVEID